MKILRNYILKEFFGPFMFSLVIVTILMTSMTTIIAILPLARGWGQGSEMLQPLGVVVASGMCLSTFVTLFIAINPYSPILANKDSAFCIFFQHYDREQ